MKQQPGKKFSFSPTGRLVKPGRWWYADAPEDKREWTHEPVAAGGGRGGVIVDFGRNVGGYPVITWCAVRGGTVRLCFSEALKYLMPNGDSAWPALDLLPALGQHLYAGRGGEKWRDPMLRGGFRYMLVKPMPRGEAVIEDIELELDFYIHEDHGHEGGFECSDADLNRIWHAAAYTIQMGTKRPEESFVLGRDAAGVGDWVIMDGAKRDRAVWALDLAVVIPSFLLAFGDAAVTRDSLASLLSQKGRGGFALKKGYIPHSAFPENRLTWHYIAVQTFSNYVMWWIRGACDHYLYTGDAVFARDVIGDIEEAFEWLETQARPSPESGTPLFHANGLNDLSWDYTIRRRGFSGATNLLWAVTLEESASMAESVDPEYILASRWRARAAQIRAAVFETGFKPFDLFDAEQGRFRHTTREDKLLALEVNALAALHDFVTGDTADRLLDLIAARNRVRWGTLAHDRRITGTMPDYHHKKVMPCIVSLEVAALMKLGRLREALDVTRATWLPMLEQDPRSTFWEWYGHRGGHTNSFMSLCHPWSAAILQRLTEGLSGVRPLAPGYSEIELDPAPAVADSGLKYLRFIIPTPHGSIEGEWNRKRGAAEYELDCPPGVKGVLKKDRHLDIRPAGSAKKSAPKKFSKKIALSLKPLK